MDAHDTRQKMYAAFLYAALFFLATVESLKSVKETENSGEDKQTGHFCWKEEGRHEA